MLEESDWPILSQNYVDPVNGLCGTLLDYGDVDHFNQSQCARLKAWLEIQLSSGLDGRTRYLYEKLLGFATRAIEIGIVVLVEF